MILLEFLEISTDNAVIDNGLVYYTNFYTISAWIGELRHTQIKTSMLQNP